jgi:hypothetical protein
MVNRKGTNIADPFIQHSGKILAKLLPTSLGKHPICYLKVPF